MLDGNLKPPHSKRGHDHCQPSFDAVTGVQADLDIYVVFLVAPREHCDDGGVYGQMKHSQVLDADATLLRHIARYEKTDETNFLPHREIWQTCWYEKPKKSFFIEYVNFFSKHPSVIMWAVIITL